MIEALRHHLVPFHGREGVPLGYYRLGDHICPGCRAATQKGLNIRRDPGWPSRSRQDIKGVMIQGEATADTVLRLSREAARLRGVSEAALPTEARPGTAYMKVEPRRVISWDCGRNADSGSPVLSTTPAATWWHESVSAIAESTRKSPRARTTGV